MEQYNFRLKEYRKIALKFYLAPWRVLGIDKCGALTRAAAKHTPRKRRQEQHGKLSKTGLPKKICKAKIFWEEET